MRELNDKQAKVLMQLRMGAKVDTYSRFFGKGQRSYKHFIGNREVTAQIRSLRKRGLVGGVYLNKGD